MLNQEQMLKMKRMLKMLQNGIYSSSENGSLEMVLILLKL